VVLVVVHSSGLVAVVSWQERLTEFIAVGGAARHPGGEAAVAI
jgi:hypothetical protein